MNPAPDIVVGSGPSGVAVASALLAAGRAVLMVDPGGTLEPELAASKQRLADTAPEAWTSENLAFLKPQDPNTTDVPDKLSFGSSFPYAAPAVATQLECSRTGLKPSYAVGGLSTVWGGAMLPFRDIDTRDWPVSADDLAEGYAAVSGLMPCSATSDDLADTFPLHTPAKDVLPPSRQAEALLRHMAAHREQLAAQGISFGTARLAVEASACVRCGLCLSGCPHDLIYSTRATLAQLCSKGLRYESGLVVQAVSETGTGVEVRAVRLDGSSRILRGARVFLAAGVVNTTEIMLRSMECYDKPVSIKDAQYFLLPIVRRRGTPNVEGERLHTLCQIFLEMLDLDVSPSTVHLQLYTYNTIIRDLLRTKLGVFAPFVPLAPFLGRLMVLQSYLHSDESGTIAATLGRRGDGDYLSLVGHRSPETPRAVARVARKLRRLATLIGFRPMPMMADITDPGRGFHCGGAFPMSRAPGPGNADLIGRPFGYSRVHLVDSSVLPSIPATTITFPVMANAFRIGASVARADAS